jgi:hypothetical protein
MLTRTFYDAAVGPTTFAERLRGALRGAGLSIAGAADIMDVTEQQMRRYLDGTTPDLKLFGALRLCERCGVDPWYLAFGTKRQAASGAEVSPQPDARVSRLERDLRDMRNIVERLEAALPADKGAQGGHRKGRRSA